MARVGMHVGENQKPLPRSPSACREIEGNAAFAAFHSDLSPLLQVSGVAERRAEQLIGPHRRRLLPVAVRFENAEAQAAEDFGFAAFAYPHVHSASVDPRLAGSEAGVGGISKAEASYADLNPGLGQPVPKAFHAFVEHDDLASFHHI